MSVAVKVFKLQVIMTKSGLGKPHTEKVNGSREVLKGF